MIAPYSVATALVDGQEQAAIVLEGDGFLLDERLPAGVRSLLDDWEDAQEFLDGIVTGSRRGCLVSEDEATVLTPVRFPDALLAVGANYSGHLTEMGLAAQRWPVLPFFTRPPRSCLVGPGRTVCIPRSTQQFDWECELAVVVGRRLRHADRAEAVRAVAGYTIGLDLTCRDLVRTEDDLGIDLARGKAQDTMAPCGPVLVPARFLPDITDLKITLSVNGQTMMDASTAEMLYQVDEQLSILSEYMTLMPGDIVFTGSPAGSAAHHGGRWLQPGDRIDAEITGIPPLTVVMRSDEDTPEEEIHG